MNFFKHSTTLFLYEPKHPSSRAIWPSPSPGLMKHPPSFQREDFWSTENENFIGNIPCQRLPYPRPSPALMFHVSCAKTRINTQGAIWEVWNREDSSSVGSAHLEDRLTSAWEGTKSLCHRYMLTWLPRKPRHQGWKEGVLLPWRACCGFLYP